ncbi:MAG: 5'/3'-nucleotidase SurE [Candidatus Marinimicrobia bacterium]|nr:5'/3'-nucleotidase SurE [Candidatus Neomarinimicrobiota bacterium]
MKPYILVTNDDGIQAPGIHALIMELLKFAEISVVAPLVEKSAVGHAITLSDPLRVEKFNKNGLWEGLAVSGTPADCVKIALNAVLNRKPDFVVSGINLGSNTGINVIYSGTVSAATEGAISGIPSIAISLTTYTHPKFEVAAKFAGKIVKNLIENPIESKTLLNINVPNVSEEEIRGVRVARQGMANFAEEFDKRIDPKGRTYYWLTGSKNKIEEPDDVDDNLIKENFITVTPLQFNLTDFSKVKAIEERIAKL